MMDPFVTTFPLHQSDLSFYSGECLDVGTMCVRHRASSFML